MKTTSLITVSGAIAVILLALIKINGEGTFKSDSPTQTSEKSQSAAINNASLVDLLPVKYVHNSSPFYVQPAEATGTTRLEGPEEKAITDGELNLDEIVFMEEEISFDLGFDLAEYLPADFDPYAAAGPALDEIVFLEAEEEIDLGFDTTEYLPIGFDVFATADPDLDAIEFIEADETDLGFDTSAYLPVDFDPYAKPEPDLQDIAYLEEEAAIELDFDVDAYLPADFDPYAPAAFDLDQIIFIEEEEEIDLWQETGSESRQETATNVVF